MNQKNSTEPVLKLVLFTGLGGVFVTIIGITWQRDLLAVGGILLVASCIHAIARLVK